MLRFSLLAAGALLAACGGREPVDSQANKSGSMPASLRNAPDASGAPPANSAHRATGAGPASALNIPAALQGRWGLSPADCGSRRGDAKGLLVVGGDDLRFYESRAVPAAGVQTTPDSISGTFVFTGEGQTWTKFTALQLQKRGLVRTESNPGASFTYARCK